MRMKWQEEALNSKSRFVIARAPRRSGKTLTAIKWARKDPGKNVLFIGMTDASIRVTMDQMYMMYREEVTVMQKGIRRIEFSDGTKVNFVDSFNWQRIHGQRVNKVIVEDVFSMAEKAVESILGLAPEQLFITGTNMNELSNVILDSESEGIDAHLIKADYLDMLEAGLLTADAVRKLDAMLTPEQFQKEFGPWKNHRSTNRDFLGLLQK